MNVLLALLITIIFAVLLAVGVFDLHCITWPAPLPAGCAPIANGLLGVIFLNWALAFFNLIPCPPLDGGAVLAGVLPDRFDNVNSFLKQYGFLILIGLLLSGAVSYFLIPAQYVMRFFMMLVSC